MRYGYTMGAVHTFVSSSPLPSFPSPLSPSANFDVSVSKFGPKFDQTSTMSSVEVWSKFGRNFEQTPVDVWSKFGVSVVEVWSK